MPTGGTSEAKVDNWDAIIGLKGRVLQDAQGKWFVPYYVDVGTGDSNLTWQALVGLGYQFRWGSVNASWRYLDISSSRAMRSTTLPSTGLHWP